jgi:diguanylate cyclase
MAAARDVRLETVEYRADQVFGQIWRFLTQHRLSPDPLHYAFAYRVISHPDGVLAKSVAALTEGGIRLTARDIEKLGGQVTPVQMPVVPPAPDPVDGLVAQTQMQVEGFTDMMHAIREEAQGFGRDLAASANAMRGTDSSDDIVQLTEVMLDRLQSAEARLAAATHEAEELRLKLEEARSNARSDPLTNLPNRRAFEENFAQHVAGGETVCLAVCDVDRFKRVNDRFGHSVGDRVLKAIAEALDQAYATLERARTTVADKRYRLRESDEPLGAVTFSAGVTQAQPYECLGAVFGRADKLLYAAKDGGRNQIRRV